jgi:hypothetical protein
MATTSASPLSSLASSAADGEVSLADTSTNNARSSAALKSGGNITMSSNQGHRCKGTDPLFGVPINRTERVPSTLPSCLVWPVVGPNTVCRQDGPSVRASSTSLLGS